VPPRSTPTAQSSINPRNLYADPLQLCDLLSLT